MTDATNLIRIVQETQPDEIYNLAAQSHVQVSFETPEYTANADALGTLRLLEAIRILGLERQDALLPGLDLGAVRQGASSRRRTRPRRSIRAAPTRAAKLYAYWIVVNYREAYGLHASNGILFNHESPLRGETFVTRKITRAVAAIHLGLQDKLYLGNLDAKRDWGHAREYVRGMWLMLQQDEPDDYVLATGETTLVRDFVEHAFAQIGIAIDWRGRRDRGTGSGRQERPRAGRGRPALLPPDRGRPPDRRCRQGEGQARLAVTRPTGAPSARRWSPRIMVVVPNEERRECRLRRCFRWRASACGSPATVAWSARRWCGGWRGRTARS